MLEKLLEGLTESQREAVLHTEGPLLILAGAGSGKTRVITRRVAYLLQQGVAALQILAITFTNKAAGEMRQRVEALVPGSRVWISTFHSLGARLLRQYADRLGLDRNFTIYDQADRTQLVKIALDAAGIDNVRFTPETHRRRPSARRRTSCCCPDKYAEQANDFFSQMVAQVYPVYEKKLRDANALDFDDLLYWPALALKNDEELRAELDARFRFVLIDEYQDTNQAQYEIARRLSRRPPEPVRRRRPGPVDLQVARLRHPQHPRLRARLPRAPGSSRWSENYRSTKAILRGRRPRSSPTTSSASRRTCHRQRRRAQPVHGADLRDRAWTRPRASPGASASAVEAGKRRYRDFAIFLRINALSRSLEAAFVKHARAVPDRQGPGVLRPQGEPATSSPTCGCWSTRATTCRSCASSTSRPAASARCRWSTCGPTPSRAS